MLELLPLQPFAIGGKRECYVHPEAPSRCVKVHRPEFLPRDLWKQAPWHRRLRKTPDDFDESYGEWRVIQALQTSGDDGVWAHLPLCDGWVETDRGRGLVIELLRDTDGLISLSLQEWLWRHGRDERLDRALDAFGAFWSSHVIPSRSLGLHNLVMQEQAGGEFRIVFIDGLGSTEFVPFSTWSRAHALRKSARKVERLRQEVGEWLVRREKGLDPGHRGFLLSRQ